MTIYFYIAVLCSVAIAASYAFDAAEPPRARVLGAAAIVAGIVLLTSLVFGVAEIVS